MDQNEGFLAHISFQELLLFLLKNFFQILELTHQEMTRTETRSLYPKDAGKVHNQGD